MERRFWKQVPDRSLGSFYAGVFATAALGIAEYALAGHPPILHRPAGGARIRRLCEGSIPVGLLGGRTFPSQQLRLEPGDVLAIVTDGLIEVEDASGRELGLERLEAALATGAGAPDTPRDLLERLLETARSHGSRADDQSALVVRYTG